MSENKVWVIVYTQSGFYEEPDPKYMLKWGVFKTFELACAEALRRFEGDRAMCYHVSEARILDGLFEFNGDGSIHRYEVVGVELKG